MRLGTTGLGHGAELDPVEHGAGSVITAGTLEAAAVVAQETGLGPLQVGDSETLDRIRAGLAVVALGVVLEGASEQLGGALDAHVGPCGPVAAGVVVLAHVDDELDLHELLSPGRQVAFEGKPFVLLDELLADDRLDAGFIDDGDLVEDPVAEVAAVLLADGAAEEARDIGHPGGLVEGVGVAHGPHPRRVGPVSLLALAAA